MRGIEAIKTIGIQKDAWFVTLHVREGKFGEHQVVEPFRDADPTSYLDAVTAVTNRGGWVVRTGDGSMSPLPKMQNVFDYATSELRCHWMDVFLFAAAKFMIGTSSGPATVSHAFGVPIAMTNYLPTATLYLSKLDLFIPKVLRSKTDGSMVSFSKPMSLPLSTCASDGMFKNVFEVEVIPNTSQEILELVEEMVCKLERRHSKSAEGDILKTKTVSL